MTRSFALLATLLLLLAACSMQPGPASDGPGVASTGRLEATAVASTGALEPTLQPVAEPRPAR